MKRFFKDFQIQIRRTKFVELRDQFYGCVVPKAPCTAITSAELLFCLLEPSQQGDCFSRPNRNSLQCSLLLLRRGY